MGEPDRAGPRAAAGAFLRGEEGNAVGSIAPSSSAGARGIRAVARAGGRGGGLRLADFRQYRQLDDVDAVAHRIGERGAVNLRAFLSLRGPVARCAMGLF